MTHPSVCHNAAIAQLDNLAPLEDETVEFAYEKILRVTGTSSTERRYFGQLRTLRKFKPRSDGTFKKQPEPSAEVFERACFEPDFCATLSPDTIYESGKVFARTIPQDGFSIHSVNRACVAMIAANFGAKPDLMHLEVLVTAPSRDGS